MILLVVYALGISHELMKQRTETSARWVNQSVYRFEAITTRVRN